MKILLDMNLSPDWVGYLDQQGINSEHWSTIGAGDTPDELIMAYAVEHERVILTQDLDFGIALASFPQEKPSVIQIRTDSADPQVVGPQVAQVIQQELAQIEAGALVTVSNKRSRLRLLPIQRS